MSWADHHLHCPLRAFAAPRDTLLMKMCLTNKHYRLKITAQSKIQLLFKLSLICSLTISSPRPSPPAPHPPTPRWEPRRSGVPCRPFQGRLPCTRHPPTRPCWPWGPSACLLCAQMCYRWETRWACRGSCWPGEQPTQTHQRLRDVPHSTGPALNQDGVRQAARPARHPLASPGRTSAPVSDLTHLCSESSFKQGPGPPVRSWHRGEAPTR